MKKDIGIPGVMAVVAIFYLLGQIASCHETNKATITTEGQVTPAIEPDTSFLQVLDSVNVKLGRIKLELLKMDSLNKEIDKQNKEFDSLLNSMQ